VKTIPSALLTHYGQDVTTVAHALKITRADAQVFGFTSHDQDVTISGVTYGAAQGLDASAIVTAAGGAVGNLEIRTLNDGSLFTLTDILGGVWRNAAFLIFRYNWATPANGIDTLLAGTLGEIRWDETMLTVELRDLRQYLQQPVGSASSKNCRYRLGSTDKNNGGLCMIDLPSLMVVGVTVTSVTDNRIFVASPLALPLHWLSNGYLTWLTGANAGLDAQIQYQDENPGSGNEAIQLSRPMVSAIQIGDTFNAFPGCRKRLTEDCIGKFNNVLNFGGEPHRPGIDSLTQAPSSNV